MPDDDAGHSDDWRKKLLTGTPTIVQVGQDVTVTGTQTMQGA